MAASCTMIERRRASRVRVEAPLTIIHENPEGEVMHSSALAVEASRCGARLRAPVSSPIGSRIRVVIDATQESREFRVIRASERDGMFELGVEILYPGRNFWDVRFPDESFEYAEADLAHEFPRV
jgi:PilZ domain